MFVVDVSPHMSATRSIELPDGVTLEITHLEWALQFVMMKVEEMVRGFSGRLWRNSYTLYADIQWQENGSVWRNSLWHGWYADVSLWQKFIDQTFVQGTQNALNDKRGDYEHVTEYIPIGQPNGVTMARLAALQPSETTGDRM